MPFFAATLFLALMSQTVFGAVFVLAVGTSGPSTVEPQLAYPGKDANLFVNTLRLAGAVTGATSRTLVDSAVTLEGLNTELAWLISNATASDTIILFFAGHMAKGLTARLRYVTSLSDGRTTLSSGVDFASLIREVRQGARFKYMLLFVDACYSGGLSEESLDGSVPRESDGSPRKFFALFSSAPQQQSFESLDLQHGVFSYFLAEGLSGRADANADQRVTIQELVSFIRKEIARFMASRNLPNQEPASYSSHAGLDLTLVTLK
jgi:uncharacterized caspase-like protein